MSIFQGSLTQPWTKSVKSRGDAEMASISGPRALADETIIRGGRPDPISSPFRRLECVMDGF